MHTHHTCRIQFKSNGITEARTYEMHANISTSNCIKHGSAIHSAISLMPNIQHNRHSIPFHNIYLLVFYYITVVVFEGKKVCRRMFWNIFGMLFDGCRPTISISGQGFSSLSPNLISIADIHGTQTIMRFCHQTTYFQMIHSILIF